MRPVPVSSTRALPPDYFDRVLSGRDILSKDGMPAVFWRTGQFFHVENVADVKLKAVGSSSSRVVTQGDSAKNFMDIYDLQLVEGDLDAFRLALKDEKNRLVVTEDGKVLGTLIAQATEDGRYTISMAPAYAFLNPPAEHVREHLLKTHFDKAILKGREIEPVPAGLHHITICLERRPERVGQYAKGFNDITLGGTRYTDAISTISWLENSEHTGDDLSRAYRDALLAQPADIGKLVVTMSYPERIVGVLVKETTEYSDSHKRWYQKAYICPAADILRP